MSGFNLQENAKNAKNEKARRDRTYWPAGPWDKEPDRIEWRYKGLPCLIVRGPVGALCGYAAVGPAHPWHGASYGDCVVGCKELPVKPVTEIGGEPISEGMQKILNDKKNFECREDWKPEHTPESIIDVHGGLTYSNKCQEGGDICHVPQAGEPDPVWWFGFDCAHSGDLAPGLEGTRVEMHTKACREEIELRQKGGPIERLKEVQETKRIFGSSHRMWGDTYRDMSYVRREVEKLADQLLAVNA